MQCPLCGFEAYSYEVDNSEPEAGYQELRVVVDCPGCGLMDADEVDILLSAREDPAPRPASEPDEESPPEP